MFGGKVDVCTETSLYFQCKFRKILRAELLSDNSLFMSVPYIKIKPSVKMKPNPYNTDGD